MSNIEHLYESLKKQEMVLDKLRVEFNLLRTPDKFKRFEEVESPIFEEKPTTLPQKSTTRSAGYDFYLKTDVVLESGDTKVVFTDVKCFLLPEELLYLHVRSSVGTYLNICLANGTGVIDSDYYENENNDGNIGISLYNFGNKTVTLREGERIAQGVIHRIVLDESDEGVTDERKGGFGHTGK